MTIAGEINNPSSWVFRRAHIQRRNATTGLFEGTWTSITPYVKNWGTLESSIDDVRFNAFKHSGITLKARNDTGAFNHESLPSSLWFGFMTRYRTLIRIQAGYEDTNATDLPTDPTQGIYVMDKEAPISADGNDITIKCSSLQSIFEEVRARDVAGLGVTTSAGAIIAGIRGHSDASGNAIFTQFITSTAWTVDSNSANFYNPATSTSLENLTCWGLMQNLAEAEGKVVYITRAGGIRFEARPIATGTSIFTFAGQGYGRQSIIRLTEYKQALDKFYSFFRLKYLQAITSTSYVTAGTITSINVSNISWRYGQRVYEFENTFVDNTTQAQNIVNNLFTTLGTVTSEVVFDAKMAPHVDIHDPIAISYRSFDLSTQALWDANDWNEFNWAGGQSFDWNSQSFRIISKRLNLDNFTMHIKAREV